MRLEEGLRQEYMMVAEKDNRAGQTFAGGASGYGFTLVEIIIVVVILAIAAALAIPMLGSAGSMRLSSAANVVAADLEYAKSLAITKGQNFSVAFNQDDESYQIEIGDGSGTVIAHPVKKGFPYIVNFGQDSRFSGVDIVTVDFAPADPAKVTFDYLGSPNAGGYVLIGCNGSNMKVNVEPVTGFVSIEDVD